MKKNFKVRLFFFGLLFILVSLSIFPELAPGNLRITSTSFVPDRKFPELLTYITDGYHLKHGMGEPKPYDNLVQVGATLHIFIKNDTSAPLSIDGILLDGIDLAKHIIPQHREHGGIRAAGYLLNDNDTTPEKVRGRLDELGQPVWFRVRPDPVPPQGFSEVTVRFRFKPSREELNLRLETKEGHSVSGKISTTHPAKLTIAAVNFNSGMDRVFLYPVRDDGKDFQLDQIRIDGEEMNLPAGAPRSSFRGILPLEVPLPTPWKHGSFHHIRLSTKTGDTAETIIRARDDFFSLGMWGYRNHGNSIPERARDTCESFRDHLFNTHMGMAGSHTGYLESPSGLALLDEMGLRFRDKDPSKATVKNPLIYARFLMDEPDAHEYAVKDLPGRLRLGSYAQGLVNRQKRWTDIDPRNLMLLNVDLTYKPQNWLTYGQLPDILACDPYYQMRLRDVYHNHPGWLSQFCHPFYVYAVSCVAQWSCRPNPLHVILNSVSVQKKGEEFRYGTPEEKRIEFYYALAAGAKGISYWWFTPYGMFKGCGSDDPAAKAMMKEMKRLNAEVRPLSSLFASSCPAMVPGEKVDPLTMCLPPWLMARTLLAGTDTALVILINRDHSSDRAGTYFTEIPKAVIEFQTPPWMHDIKVFRFSRGKMEPLAFTGEPGKLTMKMQNISLTEILILTQEDKLPDQINKNHNQLSK